MNHAIEYGSHGEDTTNNAHYFDEKHIQSRLFREEHESNRIGFIPRVRNDLLEIHHGEQLQYHFIHSDCVHVLVLCCGYALVEFTN